MIPIIASLIESDEERRAWRVVATVANLMLGALLLLAAILFILAPWLVPIITPGFEQPQLDQEVELTRIMLLSPVFLALGSMATSVLNSRGKFAESAIAPIVYNLAIIGGTILLGPSLGVTGVAIAVVAGSIGHLLVQLPSTRRLGYRHHFHIDRHDPQARRAFALMAPRAIGLGAVQITFVVVTAVASTLGTGSVTAFNNAFLLLQIPLGVIGVPLGIVLLPTLSRDAAAGRPEEFAGRVARALRLLVFVMVPIAGLGIVLRNETSALLFGHGQITVATVDATAAALGALLLGLVAHSMIAVVARAFYARQDTRTPVGAGLVAVVLDCVLAVILSAQFGLAGIGLAIAIGAWVEVTILLVILRARVQELSLRGVLVTGIKALAATLVACIVAIALNGGLGLIGKTDPGVLALAVRITIVGGLGLGVYLLLALALRIPELPSIVGIMADLLRRPRRA
jgi:putative peptidoglycan lipid II flippase